MQKAINVFCIAFSSLFVSHMAMAQQPSLGCNDKAIRLQAEQIKQDFKAQGQVVSKDAMITMESKQPAPIAVQFTKGKLYQLIFVGSRDANRIKLELFDGADKRIGERMLKEPEKTNFIVYSFVPERTDMYLVVLTQNKGMKEMCGSFTIMEAAPEAPAATPTTAPAKNTPANKKVAPTPSPKKTGR